MSMLPIYLLPFFIGLWIGVTLRSWPAFAICVGIPLAVPPTATLIPTLVSSRADSIWSYAIPMFGAGLSCGGLFGVIKIVIGSMRSRV